MNNLKHIQLTLTRRLEGFQSLDHTPHAALWQLHAGNSQAHQGLAPTQPVNMARSCAEERHSLVPHTGTRQHTLWLLPAHTGETPLPLSLLAARANRFYNTFRCFPKDINYSALSNSSIKKIEKAHKRTPKIGSSNRKKKCTKRKQIMIIKDYDY